MLKSDVSTVEKASAIGDDDWDNADIDTLIQSLSISEGDTKSKSLVVPTREELNENGKVECKYKFDSCNISENITSFKSFKNRNIFTVGNDNELQFKNDQPRFQSILSSNPTSDSLLKFIVDSMNSFLKLENGKVYEHFLDDVKIRPFQFRDDLNASTLKSPKNILTFFSKSLNNDIQEPAIDAKIYDKLFNECFTLQDKLHNGFKVTIPESKCQTLELSITDSSCCNVHVYGQPDLEHNNISIELKSVGSFSNMRHLEDMLNQIAIYQMLYERNAVSKIAYLLLLARDTQKVLLFKVSENNVPRFQIFIKSSFRLYPTDYLVLFTRLEDYHNLKEAATAADTTIGTTTSATALAASAAVTASTTTTTNAELPATVFTLTQQKQSKELTKNIKTIEAELKSKQQAILTINLKLLETIFNSKLKEIQGYLDSSNKDYHQANSVAYDMHDYIDAIYKCKCLLNSQYSDKCDTEVQRQAQVRVKYTSSSSKSASTISNHNMLLSKQNQLNKDKLKNMFACVLCPHKFIFKSRSCRDEQEGKCMYKHKKY